MNTVPDDWGHGMKGTARNLPDLALATERWSYDQRRRLHIRKGNTNHSMNPQVLKKHDITYKYLENAWYSYERGISIRKNYYGCGPRD
jgi:hypothetical protein